jgi:hypothetical protein
MNSENDPLNLVPEAFSAPTANRNVSFNQKIENSIISIGFLSVLLKRGIIIVILGFEILNSLIHRERLESEVEQSIFDLSDYKKSQNSLIFMFLLSLIVLLIEILILNFLKNICKNLKKPQIPLFSIDILKILAIESIKKWFCEYFDVVTGLKNIENYYLFVNKNVFLNLVTYGLLYFPNTPQTQMAPRTNVTIPAFLIIWVADLLYITLFKQSEIERDIAVPFLKINLISDRIKKTFEKYLLNENLDLLVPSTDDFEKSKEIYIKPDGFENEFCIPRFVIKNYKEKGLFGNFLFYSTFIKENKTVYPFLFSFNSFYVLLICILAFFTLELKHPSLGILCGARFLEFIQFLSILFINKIQKSNELKSDLLICKKGYKTELLEYFLQKTKIEDQLENVHFSQILSTLSPFNSLISRIKNLN